ncbi:MAG: biotin--[acetyl-CoA-carboxylase] ligase, partial [Chloroflexota bacterium]|nr:biotin--[acetyl-CoA-carboxylase] ligase [Chloroflexota bacterium]
MPPNFVAATIRRGLYTRIVGRRLLYYPELSSTMDEAARLGEGNTEEGAVVVAEIQSAGRGRQGRSWISQPGNLLVSVLFRPSLEKLPFISIIGGIAAARAVRKVTGLDIKIKWPNDLMIDGRKAAGILAESAIAGDSVWY